MKEVTSKLCPIDLKIFTNFAEIISESNYWLIQNLDYGGEPFTGKNPEEIEEISKIGLKFDAHQMREFELTVNQIFEGMFAMVIVDENLHDTYIALEVEIYDGEVWQLGGAYAKRFLLMNQITYR